MFGDREKDEIIDFAQDAIDEYKVENLLYWFQLLFFFF